MDTSPVQDSGEDSGDTGDTDTPWQWPEGTTLVLRDIKAVDRQGGRGPLTVVVVGERIVALREEVPEEDPPGAQVLEGGWVSPGLVDPHVHLFMSSTPWSVGDTLASNLRAFLYFGVTSVVDAGAPEGVWRLRDRVEAGQVLGPSIRATGPFLTTPLGHPCETWNDPTRCWFAQDATQGEQWGNRLVAQGSDGIKLALCDASFTPWPSERLSLEAAAAALEATSRGGLFSLAHVDEEIDALDALDLGVDHLAHPAFGGWLSEAGVQRIASEARAQHTTLGATSGPLDAVDGGWPWAELEAVLEPEVVESYEAVNLDPSLVDATWLAEHELWTTAALHNLGALADARAPLVPASDAGYDWVPPGWSLHRELALMEDLGYSRLQVLTAATDTAAQVSGFTDRGRVEPGARADLLWLEGSPLDSLAVLASPRAVVLGGEVLEREDIPGLAVVREADHAPRGSFCVDAGDCASTVCDLVEHVCAAGCSRPYDPTQDCGAEAWCAPVDGQDDTEEGVCHQPWQTCTLYEDHPCEPAEYGETCVPGDLDTAWCWPTGPRLEGQRCSWDDPVSAGCEAGLYCSPYISTCFRLCDPDDPDTSQCPGKTCTAQVAGGTEWFGLCL